VWSRSNIIHKNYNQVCTVLRRRASCASEAEPKQAAWGAARQLKSITLESVGGKPQASGGVACHGSPCTATLLSASRSAALSDEEGSAALAGACEPPGQLPGMAYVVDTAAGMSSADAAPVTSAASAVLSAAPPSSSRRHRQSQLIRREDQGLCMLCSR
jgi:hypothetical protein